MSKMASVMGVAKNYIYLIESGRKPMTAKIAAKLADLEQELNTRTEPHSLSEASTPPREKNLYLRDSDKLPRTQAPAVSNCRYPTDCDLVRELADMKSALASLAGQVNTLTQLLGASLAKSVEAPDKRKVG